MIETPLRPYLVLNDGWRFRRGAARRSWTASSLPDGVTIELPHSWNERDTFQYERRSHSGRGVYQRTLTLPRNQGQWRLLSEGFYGLFTIWLDGIKLMTGDAQYLGFTTPPIPAGEHLVTLELDNRIRKAVLPGSKAPDFILHGGLTGRLSAMALPEIRFKKDELWLDWRPEDHEHLDIHFALDHDTDHAECQVSWRLLSCSRDQLTASQPIECSLDSQLALAGHSCQLELPEIEPWSPEHPVLYWLEGEVSNRGTVFDIIRIRFGFVDATFRDGEGLFVNGQRTLLHGCNRHEAMPGFGSALPSGFHRQDAQLMKELGCNFVRLSHYPQHPDFLDACDEFGLFVYAEIASWKSVSSKGRWRRAARRQMRELILRDRHRPSSLFWGMGNESRSRKAYLELSFIAHQLDPSRSTTYAENHLYRARRKKTLGIPDVWAVNYEIDVLDQAAAASRTGNAIVSECCNHPHSLRGDASQELTQVATLEDDWSAMAERPHRAGYAVWCLADYATEHRLRYRRLAGLFDAWRQPKMAAELFRARHAKSACLSIFVTPRGPRRSANRWLDDRSTGATESEIHIFSNCPRITIALGDRTVECGGALHTVLDCPEIDAFTAVGKLDEQRIETSWRLPKAAVRLAVEIIPELVPGLLSFEISARDAHDVIATEINRQVHLHIDGPGRLHCYTESHEVELTRGTGRAFVTPTGQGVLRLTASSPGLEDARLDHTI